MASDTDSADATGLLGRILKFLLGTPFFLVGVVLLFFGVQSLTSVTDVAMVVFGAVFTFAGLLVSLSAVQGGDISVGRSRGGGGM